MGLGRHPKGHRPAAVCLKAWCISAWWCPAAGHRSFASVCSPRYPRGWQRVAEVVLCWCNSRGGGGHVVGNPASPRAEVAPKAQGQPAGWAFFKRRFLKNVISSWLCSVCFSLCSVINMYLSSHVLIQQHDKYLSFDIVSKDINWSIYHIHPAAEE